MAALICGSLAYDTIMVFGERFKDYILPDQVHILNVSFLVPKLRREFGGVAGNISYNLKLLGGDPYPMATVGDDFDPYAERLDDLGISTRYVRTVDGTFTAQAFITTDLDDNQITAFHPGAMQSSHLNRVTESEDIRLGVIAPDGRQAMLQHSREFADEGIPHIFDPGQGLPMFNGLELKSFIDNANWVIVNDYESQMLQQRTGLNARQIAGMVDAYIVTLGAEGSLIHTREDTQRIETPEASRIIDPTGCGDAYRGGMLYGLLNGMDLPTSCRIGSLMGSIKIASQGPQNHTFTPDEFKSKFKSAFGYTY